MFRSCRSSVPLLHVGDGHLRSKAGLQDALGLHLGHLLRFCRIEEIELLDFAVGAVAAVELAAQSSVLFAVAFCVRAARYWPTAVRQSGETESDISIMASCESCGLPRVCCLAGRQVMFPLTGIVAACPCRASKPTGELVLSAIVMPLVSPNILATLAFLRAVKCGLPLLLEGEVRRCCS